MPLALRLDHVSFAYGHGPPVLRGVDLAVQRGEFVAIAGPNGGGKTTLVRLVVGLEQPTSGRIELRTRKVGYLPQRAQAGIDAPLTVRELVTTGRASRTRLIGPLSTGDRETVREAIERVGLVPQVDRRLSMLSGGQQQRAFIAKALAAVPELLVLDEPTSGLDPLMQQEFQELVRETRAAGQTIFMSSHVLAEVQHAADRVGIVRNGHLVAVERVESLGKRAVRHVEIHFETPVPETDFSGLAGVKDLQITGPILRCTVDGRLDPLIKAAARHTVVDLISSEPDLEGTFLSYYYEQEGDRHV